nr:major facilitator superfamily domain-containing protein 6-A-like [Onthophagus taurus]
MDSAAQSVTILNLSHEDGKMHPILPSSPFCKSLDHEYGKQRVWGTIGFGSTALISGYIVNLFSTNAISYKPAIICMLIFVLFDLIACFKLKLPVIESPKNIFRDLGRLLNNSDTIVFISFSVCAGVVDGFIVFFLFWYLEDLALASGTLNIKLIEGLTVAAETLIGEVVFFYIGGLILERFGHTKTFTMCFIFYALRLGLISIVPNPWWILLIECFMQGPTYALTYTTIVEYANVIAPPGMSATLQGIAAGMDDGFGYAIGGILGGVIYKYLGGRYTFQIFSTFALLCSLIHVILHKTILKSHFDEDDRKDVVYHVTEQSNLMTENNQKKLEHNTQNVQENQQKDLQNVQKLEQVT